MSLTLFIPTCANLYAVGGGCGVVTSAAQVAPLTCTLTLDNILIKLVDNWISYPLRLYD